VQRGAHVHEGELLAVLENADLAAQLQDTRGAMAQADAFARPVGSQ
jgi:multidrug efflux pump subunit AcrA (membrane-fusion protein)